MAGIKALMYGWEFPPRISGGLGIACYAIVQELAKKNVALTLVLPQTVTADHPNGVTLVDYAAALSTTERELLGNINIRYPGITTRLRPYLSSRGWQRTLSEDTLQEFLSLLNQMYLPPELGFLVRAMLYDQAFGLMNDRYEVSLLTEVFRYALFAGSLAKEITHDVIHAHDWLTVLAALEAKRHSHKPLIFHVHALETDRSGYWVDKRIFAIEKYGMEQADRIIAVSQYTKNNIVQYYGIPPEKITVVHNGIYADTMASGFKKSTRAVSHQTVLFLGRITQQKGPYFFIEVAKKVLEKKPDVHFVLAGTGDLYIDMIERVASLRIGKNVHFTGFLTGDRIRDIYELADVYVMPSVSEPFGLSALEALSCNVPAIISKQSGVAEVLHHTLVSDFWDTEDMAAKILALLDYRALRETSLAHSQGDLQELTWDKTANKILQLYKQLIAE